MFCTFHCTISVLGSSQKRNCIWLQKHHTRGRNCWVSLVQLYYSPTLSTGQMEERVWKRNSSIETHSSNDLHL